MKRIKKYLQSDIDINSTNRKFYLVFFTVFSAFIFLNFFEPFGLYYDDSISKEAVFYELLIAMTLAFVVLLLSQFVVRALLNKNKFTIISIFFWFLLEAALVASIWFVFEIATEDFTDSLLSIWYKNFVAFIVIMFLPYFLYINYVYNKDVIKRLEHDNLTNTPKDKLKQNITIKDENDSIKLLLKTEDLLFIQSADNYVEVNFMKEGLVTKTLLRNSIKKLEPIFVNSSIMRCHRSYIVNTENVAYAKKTLTGFDLKLNHVSKLTIPVSKSYISEFKKFLK